MKPTTTKTLYWVVTILFSLLLLMDAFGGIMRFDAGKEVMNHLGYPVYFLTISGIAKLLAVIALIQTKFNTIKEWAFAGIAFTFIGGFASRYFVGDEAGITIFPLIMLGIMFIPYFLWKKYQRLKMA